MALAPEILFRLGHARHVLPLAQVHEVVLPSRLTRIPRAPPAVCGAINVRGRAVLVIDAEVLLCGSRSAGTAGSERILVLAPRSRDLGLRVSEVLAITQLGQVGELELAADRSLPATPPARLDVEELSQQINALFSGPSGGRSPMLRDQPLGR